MSELALNFDDQVELEKGYFSDVVDKFEDDSIDPLHIDTPHTYTAVKDDFESYLPKLSSRAVVLFHDIAVFKKNCGVWKLCTELSKNIRQ